MAFRSPPDFVRKKFAEAVRNARRARVFVFLAVAVFAAGVAAGLLFPSRFDALLYSLRTIAEQFRGRGAGATVILIFVRNFSAATISLMTGALLGVVPLAAAGVNGVVVGVVVSHGTKISLLTVVARLIPHGIFELPAIFLAWGMGIWLMAWPFRRDARETYCERLKGALTVLFTFIVPLLMVAAVIEGLSIVLLGKH